MARTLAAEGEPLTGVLLALAIAEDAVPPPVARKKQTVFECPLEAPIERIAGLAADGIGPDRGAYFSGDDAAALRRLRTQGIAMLLDEESGLVPSLIYVRDCGQMRSLNMRDELPARVESELEALLAVAWKRPQIPSCFVGEPEPRSPCPL